MLISGKKHHHYHKRKNGTIEGVVTLTALEIKSNKTTGINMYLNGIAYDKEKSLICYR